MPSSFRLRPAFLAKRANISLYYLNLQRHYILSEKYELIVLKSRVNSFSEMVIWDGKGSISISAHSGKTESKVTSSEKFGNTIYEVRFGNDLERLGDITLDIRCSIKDFGNAFSRTLVKEIRYPTSNLTLEVLTDPYKTVDNISNREYTYLTDLEFKTRQNNIIERADKSTQLLFSIKRPVLRKCYAIKWSEL